jgi:hypothetical protein
MMIQVPAVRGIYAGHFGSGVREVVNPGNLQSFTGNGFGVSGLSGWFDGVDWGSIIETGAKAGASIAQNQWGQPNLKPGQTIQRVRNADGSYSEVLAQQTPGVPIGFNTTTAGAAAAGIGVGTLAMIGVGLVAVFMLQGRGGR